MEQDGLLVQVNDWMRELASDGEGSGTQTWDFICECPDLACDATVNLRLSDFDERRRASPPVPVHAAEHDN